MVLSRGWAAFLTGVGGWTWVIWPRFAVAIWNDPRAWSTGQIGRGHPTSFLWVHAVLIVISLVVGTAVGVLGVRAWWLARTGAATDSDPAARRQPVDQTGGSRSMDG